MVQNSNCFRPREKVDMKTIHGSYNRDLSCTPENYLALDILWRRREKEKNSEKEEREEEGIKENTDEQKYKERKERRGKVFCHFLEEEFNNHVNVGS